MTVREHMALQLAARPYRDPALFVAPARELLDLSEPRFWALVGRLLDDVDAEAEYPATVRRLRRLRDARRALRSA